MEGREYEREATATLVKLVEGEGRHKDRWLAATKGGQGRRGEQGTRRNKVEEVGQGKGRTVDGNMVAGGGVASGGGNYRWRGRRERGR